MRRVRSLGHLLRFPIQLLCSRIPPLLLQNCESCQALVLGRERESLSVEIERGMKDGQEITFFEQVSSSHCTTATPALIPRPSRQPTHYLPSPSRDAPGNACPANQCPAAAHSPQPDRAPAVLPKQRRWP